MAQRRVFVGPAVAFIVGLGLAIPPLVTLAGSPPTPASAAATAELPDTPAAHCAQDFIALLNDVTPASVERFETRWASKARLAKATPAERASRLKEMNANWGAYTIVSVLSSSDSAIELRVNTRSGETVDMEFQFADGEPNKLDAVVIKSGGGGGGVESLTMTADQRREVVAEAAAALRKGYVFPDVAEKMAQSVLTKLSDGGYDSIDDESRFARQLTDDLRAISHDRHLAVRLAPASADNAATHIGPSDADLRRNNYGFKKVEVLPGNVGYFRFDFFMDSDDARLIATDAISFLANSDALIFDMRKNGGGSPEMIRYITSYLFESPTLLNRMLDRDGKVVGEFTTLADVPGRRPAAGIPVYVLTSSRTFSGAEEFTYNLKNLKRATIVGETTGGGAHPVRGERLNDRFMIGVPFMRAQNPITMTNWEGTGVEPDVKVPADQALDKATELAMDAIKANKQQAPAPKP